MTTMQIMLSLYLFTDFIHNWLRDARILRINNNWGARCFRATATDVQLEDYGIRHSAFSTSQFELLIEVLSYARITEEQQSFIIHHPVDEIQISSFVFPARRRDQWM